MQGIDISRSFYEEYGKPMIENEFSEYAHRIAVGLVGHGSECFGFDDEVSRDHDFEPGFCIWLTDEDERIFGFRLFRAYSKLPTEYMGISVRQKSMLGSESKGVMTVSDFYKRYTGRGGAPERDMDWLYIPSHYLAEATNGEVFCDPLGEFSRIREKIKNGMPEDVRLKKIASCALYMAQTGQYNYRRCLLHGESGAARLALADFARNAVEMIFLLNRAHMPYYKWSFRAMSGLDILGDKANNLNHLVNISPDRASDIENEIESISASVIEELKRQSLSTVNSDYLEGHAFAINSLIRNSEIRNMHIML